METARFFSVFVDHQQIGPLEDGKVPVATQVGLNYTPEFMNRATPKIVYSDTLVDILSRINFAYFRESNLDFRVAIRIWSNNLICFSKRMRWKPFITIFCSNVPGKAKLVPSSRGGSRIWGPNRVRIKNLIMFSFLMPKARIPILR